MSRVVAEKNAPRQEGDRRMFDAQASNPSPYVSHGLSLLNSISTMSIQQEASVGQAITGMHTTAHRFRVFNEQGQFIFYAAEMEGDMVHRVCCGGHRRVVLHICDQSNQEVMRFSREFKCCGGCCCWCADTEYCAYEGMVESPPGVVIGTIRQTRSFWRTHLSLKDHTGNEQLRIIGPYCICQGVLCCCCENKFKLVTINNEAEIGGVFKEYAGVVNQAVTGAEKYTIRFPMNLPPQLKAIALGALFLINFKHFGGNAKTKGGCSIFDLIC